MKKRMLKKDLQVFKKLLQKKNEDLLDQIKSISASAMNQSQREAAGDISGYSFHMADAATDTFDREFSVGLASNDRELLYEIVEAFKKIEDGSYGTCESCKKNISKSRLKAIPYTRNCLKCQKLQESK